MRNNKGFSLVELIIVIAIMAILVGVMAPQLIKYIEKTNVSSDTQLCDSVKTAITTAMMDPTVLEEQASTQLINTLSQNSPEKTLADITTGNRFCNSVAETLGIEPNVLKTDIDKKIKSWNSTTGGAKITFKIVSSNSVHVYIKGSDSRGAKGQTDKVTGAYVANRDMIYVD